MRIKYIFLLLFVSVFAVSCGSKKKVITKKKNDSGYRVEVPAPRENTNRDGRDQKIETLEPSPRRYSVEDYIKDFSDIAQEEMRLYNIPASITLAQGILESGAGQGDLSRRANNHFGIKCHDWDGPRVYHDDDARGECFRKYKDVKYSYRDHSLFLTERARYATLFDLSTDDYKAWARGLRKAGYATDRKYPEKLIGIIERYELYRYDADVLKRPSPSYTHNPEPSELTYRVEKGDTLYGIAKRHNISVKDLQRYNDLKGENLAVGQILYIISPSEF